LAYTVWEAGDGRTALELIHERPFAVVLLDLRMPGIDGLEILRLLKDEGVEVPVVVVTAHGSIPDAVEAMKLGAVDFIPKPLSPETLRRVVKQAAVSGCTPSTQTPVPDKRLGCEALERAAQALNRGEHDEADFFLRAAACLGADRIAGRQLLEAIEAQRERRGVGNYRMLGAFTWG
jgi:DNA-binding NtrC family response regulator